MFIAKNVHNLETNHTLLNSLCASNNFHIIIRNIHVSLNLRCFGNAGIVFRFSFHNPRSRSEQLMNKQTRGHNEINKSKSGQKRIDTEKVQFLRDAPRRGRRRMQSLCTYSGCHFRVFSQDSSIVEVIDCRGTNDGEPVIKFVRLVAYVLLKVELLIV